MELYKKDTYKKLKFVIENSDNIKITGHNNFFRISSKSKEKPMMLFVESEDVNITLKTEDIYVSKGLTYTTMDVNINDNFPVTFMINHDKKTQVRVENIKIEKNWWDGKEK